MIPPESERDTGDRTAIIVLGVGNPIMGDDGLGLVLLDLVRDELARNNPVTLGDPVMVEFVDGGTGGLELLVPVQDADRLLILDAVTGLAPGQVRQLRGDQVSRLLTSKLSPHQVGLLDALAAARLLGQEPAELVVVGVVPESVELRVGLSDAVAVALPEATAQAAAVLAHWLRDLASAEAAGGAAARSA